MRVRAISKVAGLTKGKVYEAADIGLYYAITDDRGQHDSWYFKERFEVVTDAALETKAMILPTDPGVRKDMPISTGVLDYFPLAIAEVARVSKAGNEQHNPGEPLHWDRTKSLDHADCIPRHLIDRGALDTDGMRHSAKLAWRALALLQTELEQEAANANAS